MSLIFARATRLLPVVVLVLTASSVAAEEPPRAFKMLLAGNVAAHVADVGTTLHALEQPGLREGNPMMAWTQDRPVAMTATRAGVVALSSWGKVEVYKRRPRLAWVWLIAETGLMSWAAIHNHRAASRSGR